MEKLPVYMKIKMYILEGINDGVWLPHSKLPTEEELCDLFDVARGTVRQALDELKNEGVVYKIHGKGTFVKPAKYEHEIDTTHFLSFWDELTRKGVEFSTEVLEVKKCKPDEQALSFLHTDEVFSIKRIRKISDRVSMYSINHVPYSIYPRLMDEENDFSSIYNLLKARLNIDIDMGQRLISSIGATKELAKLFDVDEGYPIIYVKQIVYDKKGRCVDCADIWLRSEDFHFSITMKRQS